MRAALFSWAPPTYAGGVERFTSLLARGLSERGHSVLLYNISRLADRGKRVAALRPLGVDFPAVGWELAHQFRRDGSPADMVVGDAALLWALKFSPAVAVLHGNGAGHARAIGGRRGWHLYAQYRWLINSLARRGAAGRPVVAVSEFCARAAARYTGVPDAQVIDNAVDTDHFRPGGERAPLRESFGLPRDDFLALFVGRPTYSKGIDLVQAVAARLGPGAGVVVAKPGHKRARLPGLHVLDDVPYDRMADLYRACDALLFPTRYEGCGLAVLEAMASGLPVVAGRVGAADSIARREPLLARWLPNCWTAEAFAEPLTALRENAPLRRELGEAGRHYVLRHHRLEPFLQQWTDLIESAAE